MARNALCVRTHHWYHYAILVMVETKGFRNDPRWIASHLGISALEVKLAIDRLFELELLQLVEGKLRFTDRDITTARKEQTTPALKRR